MFMLSPLDYALYLFGLPLQLSVPLCALKSRCFLRYFPLSLYMLALTSSDIGRYLMLRHYGYLAHEYFTFYYYSDALLTICLYFALIGLYSQVFSEMNEKKYVRWGAIAILVATALVSYVIVRHSHQHPLSNFVLEIYFMGELSRNLYFVGAALTYLLWGAVKKMKETPTQLVQFVLGLGIYFSAQAASYALAVLHPKLVIWRFVSYAVSFWLPVAWSYTFLKISSKDRILTAQITRGAAARA
jgi:hypothetical protein